MMFPHSQCSVGGIVLSYFHSMDGIEIFLDAGEHFSAGYVPVFLDAAPRTEEGEHLRGERVFWWKECVTLLSWTCFRQITKKFFCKNANTMIFPLATYHLTRSQLENRGDCKRQLSYNGQPRQPPEPHAPAKPEHIHPGERRRRVLHHPTIHSGKRRRQQTRQLDTQPNHHAKQAEEKPQNNPRQPGRRRRRVPRGDGDARRVKAVAILPTKGARAPVHFV